MLEDKLIMFENRLRKVDRILKQKAKQQQVSCYRLYDRDLPEFPLIIDIYGSHVQVTEYRSHHQLSDEAYEQWLEGSLQLVAKVLGKSEAEIHLKERKRKESRADQYQKTADQKQFIEVEEGGLKFLVNLSDYLDTGLFIDHRITREIVRKQSKDKRILNLFCYTGAFSVYAAAGGASKVVSVDMSNTYLQWAKENMELNGFNSSHYAYVKADVLQYLPTLQEKFDIIILDPPTFSNSKSMKEVFDIQQMHDELINACLNKLDEGGILYFSTNARKFIMSKELIQGNIEEITEATTPFDFKGKLLRWCYKISK